MLVNLSTLALAATVLSSATGVCALTAEDVPSDTPISSLLASAQTYLANGQASEALTFYDAAIARDPADYLTFFKRATAYLSLGRNAQATSDFNRVLELRPGFEGAHLQLGKIRARSADWDGAREQYRKAKQAGSSSAAAAYSALVEAEGAAKLAEAAHAEQKWDECIAQAGVAIQTANRAAALRELRSWCRFAKGEVEEGMGDLQHVLQLRTGDTAPYLTVSATTFYGLGDVEQGMAHIRKCLHSDPESKKCRKLLKQEKSVEKTLGRVNKALEKNQPMTGAKLLVPSGEDAGLINEVKEQVRLLKEQGVMPERAPEVLITRLVETACQAYYEVC